MQSFRDILFDYDKSNIRASESSKITDIVNYMTQNPSASLRIDGYADPRGTNQYNMVLSQKRVNTVRDALVKAGVAQSRIAPSHYGEARPKCTEKTEACWQLDRRVEVFVSR